VTELEDHRAKKRLSASWETMHEGEVPSLKFQFGLAMTIEVSISGNCNILGEFSSGVCDNEGLRTKSSESDERVT
jgi:hypothetical protein